MTETQDVTDLILLLGKSPFSEGRFFQRDYEDTWLLKCIISPKTYSKLKREWQNWYRSTQLGAEVANETDGDIIILTAVENDTGISGREFHRKVLKQEYGIQPRMEPCTYETIGEIEQGFQIAKQENRHLHLIISDRTHLWRIKWLVWYGRRHGLLSADVGYSYHFIRGITRKDQLLYGWAIFPITVLADLLGLREWLKESLRARRKPK